MNSESAALKSWRLQFALGILGIVLLTFVVYRPVLPGGFLMDDERLIGADNALVNGQLTLYSLWFGTDFTLATFGWWVESLMFGKNPAGYHVVNIALQAISAILLWRLLKRLKIPGAWLAAALFAVHPVCVNSVARIAELKNTLSMPFLLLSLIAYLRYEAARLYPAEPAFDNPRHSSGRATLWYVISLAAFVLALMAKTTAVMLPVVILLSAAWQRGRIRWKDVLHTSPFLALSLAFGLMSVWFQKYQALPTTQFTLPPASLQERIAAAGYDFWFYIGKALVPINLSIEYPRWEINAGAVWAYVPDLLICVVFILCWRFRRSWGRHALFGLGCFAVMLFPALGFFDAQYLTLWQVSDHLQYSALPAILALAASALVVALSRRKIFRWAPVLVVLIVSGLCFQRAEVFASPEKLMIDTVAKTPSAWGAANDLGTYEAEKGNYSKAVDDFTLSLKYNPDNIQARMNLGFALVLEGKLADAQTQYLAVLKTSPGAAPAHRMYGNLLEHQGKNTEALYQFRMAAALNPNANNYMALASLEYATGDTRRAVTDLRHVLALNPLPSDEMTALNDLAWVLATCPDDSIRNGTDAIRYAEKACRLSAFKQPVMLSTLAAAYADAGRFSDAITTAETAVNLARETGDTQCAVTSQRLLLLYRAGRPCREETPGIQTR